jgi:hypothetical protein
MSARGAAMVRAVVEQLTDPAYAAMFTDLLAQRAVEMDEGESPAVRRDSGEKAAGLLDELVESVAAEVAPREQVPA